jgi:hypothetical protein
MTFGMALLTLQLFVQLLDGEPEAARPRTRPTLQQ